MRTPKPKPTPTLRTTVETIPGVFDLTAYFDALFAIAQRVEDAQPAAPARAA